MTAAGVNATAIMFWVFCCSGLLVLTGGILAIAIIAVKDDRPPSASPDPHLQDSLPEPHPRKS